MTTSDEMLDMQADWLERQEGVTIPEAPNTFRLGPATVAEIRASNETYAALAKKHGVAKSTVYRIKKDDEQKEILFHGKLTEMQKRRIRRSHRSVAEDARRYGVSESSIYRVRADK